MSHLRDPTRLNSTPRPAHTTQSTGPSSTRRSVSPAISASGSRSGSSSRRRGSSASKENEPIVRIAKSVASSDMSEIKANGLGPIPPSPGKALRDGSFEPEDASELRKRPTSSTRRTKSPSSSPSKSKSASTLSSAPYYNGLPTLPSISDDQDPDCAVTDSPMSEKDFRPPPPAPSSAMGTEGRAVTRQRRSSSIKRKLSPGVVPVKAVDWEIPRKTFHSSIGFLALALYHLDPPSVKPLVTALSVLLVTVTIADVLRFKYLGFREQWEANLGFLMRESERDKINGVVYYLIGVIFVLVAYPREVAVVSILTLSWSDTTASTIGRLWGRYTPPLPAHLPLIPAIKFAPRKSLAGFLAATVTGAAICVGFWWRGSGDNWAILNSSGRFGLALTAGVVGVGGAISEALDLGLDDNLTLPIISGAVIWTWLSLTQIILA